MSYKCTSLSVVGLGKLGLPLAAVLASSGFKVIGADANQNLVKSINDSNVPFWEPGLQDLVQECENLTATYSTKEAVSATDATFVILPTPSTDSGWFSNDYLIKALKDIGEAIKHKDQYHLVVITSTIMPGSMNGVIREALVKHSGKNLGDQLGLCYHPEFIALGNVIQNMLYPDTLLIGESDTQAGDLLQSICSEVCQNNPSIQRMNFVNAELTKIAVNTFVTTKISYANMLSEICDHLPGADAEVVTEAVGSDSRIGKKYLKPALGYGGPCFPRDNKAFVALAREHKASCDLAVATDQLNDRQVSRLVNFVGKFTPAGDKVAILGMAYKPDTHVCDASQGVLLANQLAGLGYKVLCHDVSAAFDDCCELHDDCVLQTDLSEILKLATTLVVTTPWTEYCHLASLIPEGHFKPTTLIDPWKIVNTDSLPNTVTLVTPGKG